MNLRYKTKIHEIPENHSLFTIHQSPITMEQKKVSESITDMTDQVRKYVRLRIDLFKLDLTEKLATLTTTMLISIIFFIVFLFFTLFLSLSFIFWFKEYVGAAWAGSLIVAGFYVLLGIVVFLLRDKLFLNRIVVQISKILLEEEEEDEI
jgi:hypothetical protein